MTRRKNVEEEGDVGLYLCEEEGTRTGGGADVVQVGHWNSRREQSCMHDDP